MGFFLSGFHSVWTWQREASLAGHPEQDSPTSGQSWSAPARPRRNPASAAASLEAVQRDPHLRHLPAGVRPGAGPGPGAAVRVPAAAAAGRQLAHEGHL